MLWAPRLIASCCFASTLPRDPRMSVTAESLVVALSLGSVVSRMRTTSSAVCKLPHLRLTLVCILPVATGRLRKREPLLRRRWRHPSPMLPRSDVRSARDDARRCARLGAFPAQGLRPHERAAARHRLHAGAASRAADGRHAGSPLRSHFALCISRGAGHTYMDVMCLGLTYRTVRIFLAPCHHRSRCRPRRPAVTPTIPASPTPSRRCGRRTLARRSASWATGLRRCVALPLPLPYP